MTNRNEKGYEVTTVGNVKHLVDYYHPRIGEEKMEVFIEKDPNGTYIETWQNERREVVYILGQKNPIENVGIGGIVSIKQLE